jgi:hypothetical protein
MRGGWFATIRQASADIGLRGGELQGWSGRPGAEAIDRWHRGQGLPVAAKPSIGWRLLGTVSAVLAGMAARRLTVKGWQAATGKNPPANPAAPGTEWREAIPYAIAAGATMGLARMLATRKAAGYYRKSTGHLPPGMEEVT